jgi:putative transposase
VLEDSLEDVLAFMTFPPEHWTRTYSTDPLERLNREVKRRTDVVGIFPDQQAIVRLEGSVLYGVHDKWQAGRRYFSLDSMRSLSPPLGETSVLPGPLRLAPIR